MPITSREASAMILFIAILMLSVQYTYQWTEEQNDSEFCRDVSACTRNVDNDMFTVKNDVKQNGTDTQALCKRASRCTSTDQANITLTCDITDTVENNGQNMNKTELCSILNTCNYVTSPDGRDHCFQYLRNISHYCPYADYCGLEKTLTIPASDNTSISCCSPCSCSPGCGINRECCFHSQDKYRAVETENLTCVLLHVGFGHAGFYMVDTCSNGSACFNKGAVPKPVSSATSKRIYVNRECAACNDNDAYTIWPMAISDLGPDRAFKCASDNIFCEASYGLPGQHWSWVRNFACGPDYVTSCSRSFKHQGIIEACTRVHAPVILMRHAGVMYGNAYCMMCRGIINHYIPTDKCDKRLGEDAGKPREVSFAMLLDLEVVQAHKQTDNPCIKFDGLVHPQIGCRAVLCPEWMVRVDGRCQYYTTEWRRVAVTFQLILRPINNQQIPARLFQNMTKYDSFHLHTWLSNEGGFSVNVITSGVTAKVYMLPNTGNDVTVVKEFLLRLQYKLPYLKPSSFFAYSKRSIESRWKIVRGDNVFYLSASFYHFKYFLPDGKKKLVNVSSNDQSFCQESPLPKIYDPITVSPDFYYRNLSEVYALRFADYSIGVTKMTFCERIDLSLDEIDLLYEQVRIRFNNKTLGDAEYTAHMVRSPGRLTLTHISVCTEDILEVTNDAFYYKPKVSMLDVGVLVLGISVSQF